MDIDSLTIKDAREIASMFGNQSTQTKASVTSFGAEKAVLVTTAHRGVFFGYATEVDGETIRLRSARNCIYWPSENKGFLGLATMGPVKGARIGPSANLTLRNITSVAECSAMAAAAWEAAPWSE